jgi:hypothetical protein
MENREGQTKVSHISPLTKERGRMCLATTELQSFFCYKLSRPVKNPMQAVNNEKRLQYYKLHNFL